MQVVDTQSVADEDFGPVADLEMLHCYIPTALTDEQPGILRSSTVEPGAIQKQLRRAVGAYLASSDGLAPLMPQGK